MSLRRSVARVVRVLAVGSALAAAVAIVIRYTHQLTVEYYYTEQTWFEHYLSFAAGANSLSVNTLFSPTTILIGVAIFHSVWKCNIEVATLFGVAGLMLPGPVTLPPFVKPFATQLCPVCAVLDFGVKFPISAFVIAAALLCNLSELLRRESKTRHTRSERRGTDESLDHSSLVTRPVLGRILSSLSGYTLVVLFLAIGIGSYHSVGVYPNITGTAVSSLIICAIAFYEFVATNAAYSLAALAALTWHATLAALQYDTALSEFLLATATLLTISAAGLLYADRVAPTDQTPTRTEP